MSVRLQGFDYKLNYIPGKKQRQKIMRPITTPGTQNHSQCQTPGQYTRQSSLFVKMKNCLRRTSGGASGTARPVSWDELLEETSQDPELKELKSALARRYFTAPERQALGPQFDPVFTELAVVGGLVVRGSRIVVPRSFRDKVVQLAHKGHQGVTKKKNISGPGSGFQVWTRWWKPWKEVAIDFWGPISVGKYLLIVICKHSRWAEVEFVSTTSARAVLPKLDRIL